MNEDELGLEWSPFETGDREFDGLQDEDATE